VLVDVGLFSGEIEAASTVVRRDGGASGLLFVRHGLGITIVVGVGTGGILSETIGELEVDTDGSGDDRHLVLSECSGLVGTDDSGVGHGLASSEDTNEQVGFGHATSGESESESDGERKTLRDGDDNDCDGDNENRDEVLCLLVRSTTRIASQVDEEADHERGEEDQTGGGTNFGDKLGKVIKLELEGSVFGVTLESCNDGS
jgi:hypothetical protein